MGKATRGKATNETAQQRAARRLTEQNPSASELETLADLVPLLRADRARGDRIEVERRSRGEDHVRLLREDGHRVAGSSA